MRPVELPTTVPLQIEMSWIYHKNVRSSHKDLILNFKNNISVRIIQIVLNLTLVMAYGNACLQYFEPNSVEFFLIEFHPQTSG